MLSCGCVDLTASTSGPKCQVVSEHSGGFSTHVARAGSYPNTDFVTDLFTKDQVMGGFNIADAAVGASLFLALGDYQGSTVGIVRITYSIDAANLDITIKKHRTAHGLTVMNQPFSVLVYSSKCNLRNIFIETVPPEEGLPKVQQKD